MSGDATFAGTSYQAKAIAFVYIHILTQTRLDWLGPLTNDTPLAVSGETGGPGDDIRIEFGERHPSVEVQAKHGLTGGVRLQEAIDRIKQKSISEEDTKVILAVDRNSSKTVHKHFRKDLDHLRSGRNDSVCEETKRIINFLRGEASILHRLYVVAADLDYFNDPETKVALALLSSILVDPSQDHTALRVLITDADDICSKRLRRTRKDLVDLLNASGISIKMQAEDEQWHRQLDFTKQLVERGDASTALVTLSSIQEMIGDKSVEPKVHYRIELQKSISLFTLSQIEDSIRFAKRALDVDPNGTHALVILAHALLANGDLEKANATIERARKIAPNDINVWCGLAAVANAQSILQPIPPSEVATSESYRIMLADIALRNGDYKESIEITAALLAENHRSIAIILIRSQALIGFGESTNGLMRIDAYEEAERFSSEAIDESLSDFQMKEALSTRFRARQYLGKEREAASDLNRLQELFESHPNTIAHTAQTHLKNKDFNAALETLRHPSVNRYPILLAYRALTNAQLGRHDDARSEASSALRSIADTEKPDDLRIIVVETLLTIGDIEFAKNTLSNISITGKEDPLYILLEARIALKQGDIDNSIKLYYEAATSAGDRHVAYLCELAFHLIEIGRLQNAISVYDDIGEEDIPPSSLKYFGKTLVETGDLVRAQNLIDRLAASAPLPVWGIAIAADIALRREDIEAAINHLKMLVEQGSQNVGAQITLAELLIDHGRANDALPYVNSLAADPSLSKNDRIRVAHLLHSLGRGAESLALAFKAFRENPQDPQMHRTLIFLTLANKGVYPHLTEVGPNTHVVLESSDGTLTKYTIYDSGLIEPIRNEISIDDANTLGIYGRKLGEIITRNAGSWMEQELTIRTILPAALFAAQDAMVHYAQRFPGEPFFIKGFSIGDEESIARFRPLIASLEERNKLVDKVFELYRDDILPLGFIIEVLGGTISDIMKTISANPERLGKLHIEWSDLDGQKESQSAAFAASEIVLTWSAIETAFTINILSHLEANYTLVAPLSLKVELKEEIGNIQRLVDDGHNTLVGSGAGPRVIRREPGDIELVEELAHLQSMLTWLERTVSFKARPLNSIELPGSLEEESRISMGRSSYDAVALAINNKSTLYADDLGLRKFIPKEGTARSFSSVGFLYGLSERGVLSAHECDFLLLELVYRNYTTIYPSMNLLLSAIRDYPIIGDSKLRHVFELLVCPGIGAYEAAAIAARVLRALTLESIQLVQLGTIVNYSLDVMSKRWPIRLCRPLLIKAAKDELFLMPLHLNTVLEACTTWGQEERDLD